MSPATLSLLALLVVIGVSLTSRVNVGVLAVALAWPIALLAAGWKSDALMAVFPASLFLTLLGVTLLFGVAQSNGTIEALTHRAVRLCGGNAALLPPLFFVFACAVASIGPGAIAATALIAPLAMSIGIAARVPAFLVALMVCNGANAGNLSPISAIGVLVQGLMTKAGLGGHEWAVWAANFSAHLVVSVGAWFLFGGLGISRTERVHVVAEPAPLHRNHLLTLIVTGAWIVGVVALKLNPGFSAFAAAAFIIVVGAADDSTSLRAVPWSVIVMVCGVSVLIGVLEKTGGMELFSSLLARISSPRTVNGTIAFITGVISTYSSTSGVVYPAFLPAVPTLIEKLGGGDPLQVAFSINVGAALVDVSPLSTIGALAIAALPTGEDARALFRKMLIWGFAMSVVGALFCQLFIGFFTR